jgi:hypothetical protein
MSEHELLDPKGLLHFRIERLFKSGCLAANNAHSMDQCLFSVQHLPALRRLGGLKT